MEFKVSEYDEPKCHAYKIEAGDKLYAFDEEQRSTRTQALQSSSLIGGNQ